MISVFLKQISKSIIHNKNPTIQQLSLYIYTHTYIFFMKSKHYVWTVQNKSFKTDVTYTYMHTQLRKIHFFHHHTWKKKLGRLDCGWFLNSSLLGCDFCRWVGQNWGFYFIGKILKWKLAGKVTIIYILICEWKENGKWKNGKFRKGLRKWDAEM